jgi:hypothetical protein
MSKKGSSLIIIVLSVLGCIGEKPTTTTAPVSAEWRADGVIEDGEYAAGVVFSGGKCAVHWKTDGEYLFMAVKGETTGWVSIGFEPSRAMKDADMILGWIAGGEATVLDLYSTGAYGPHPPDEELGGTDNILEHGGKEENGYTVIEFKRKMNTGDGYDTAFIRGKTIAIIWGIAESDQLSAKHTARGTGELTIE